MRGWREAHWKFKAAAWSRMTVFVFWTVAESERQLCTLSECNEGKHYKNLKAPFLIHCICCLEVQILKDQSKSNRIAYIIWKKCSKFWIFAHPKFAVGCFFFFFLLEKRGGERFKRKCDLKKKFFWSAAMKFFVVYKGFYAALRYVISFLVSCTVLIVYHDNV